jgi:TM2 domain-containing membrane protein YozV
MAPGDNDMAEVSEKKRLVAFLLCFFLGGIGVHRFYVGKVGSGIAQIVTFGGFGIWWLVDFIMILCGKFKDKDGSALTEC